MRTRWLAAVVAGGVAVALLVYIGLATGVFAPYMGGYDAHANDSGYEHTTVAVVDGETGEELGQVEAAIADTFTKRYVGLSETESLPDDRGMLFVHGDVDERTYVMRNMSFGIDIVFIDADGTITEMYEAPKPAPGEDGNQQRYTGTGQYVLEVNKGWMADRGVETGDRIESDRVG